VIPVEPRREIEYITCPLCGMSRILEKTGRAAERLASRPRKPKAPRKVLPQSKGRIRFDAVDLGGALILQIRDPSGGRRDGVKVLRGKTLAELRDDPNYFDLVSQIRSQAENILNLLRS